MVVGNLGSRDCLFARADGALDGRFVSWVSGGEVQTLRSTQALWPAAVVAGNVETSQRIVRTLSASQGAARTIPTGFLARPAGPTYAWLPDSRHVAFLKDLKGDENTQLHVLDSRGDFVPWAVTPWPGVRSYYVAAGPDGSAKFFFASNRRDKATMDLYEADAATRTIREVARSDGQVLEWQVGRDRQLAAGDLRRGMRGRLWPGDRSRGLVLNQLE